jgi:hypothetical protein
VAVSATMYQYLNLICIISIILRWSIDPFDR